MGRRGGVNPFAIRDIRFQLNNLINRKYISYELLKGDAEPVFTYVSISHPAWRYLKEIAERLGLREEGNELLALQKIREAMINASRCVEKFGYSITLERDPATGRDVWTLARPDGSKEPVKIVFLIRIEDERKLIGDYIAGSAIALLIGLPYALISRLIGLLYGATSGFYGGTLVDIVMQRICEIVYAMPTLPFIIMISYTVRETTGTQVGIFQIIALLLIFGWSGVTIVSRSMALSIREEPYVEAAKAIGASRARVILRYIAPQLMPYFFALVMLARLGLS